MEPPVSADLTRRTIVLGPASHELRRHVGPAVIVEIPSGVPFLSTPAHLTTEPAGPAPRVTPKHTASPSILGDARVGPHSVIRAGSRFVYVSGITGRTKPISSTRFRRLNERTGSVTRLDLVDRQPPVQTRLADPEVLRYLTDRLLTSACDRHDVVTELCRECLGHDCHPFKREPPILAVKMSSRSGAFLMY